VLRLALVLLAVGLANAADLVQIVPGIRLAIPEGWTAEMTPDRRTQVWRHPTDAGVAIAVQVQTADDQRDATAHLDEALGLLKRLGHDVQVLAPIAAAPAIGPGWQGARYRFRTGPTTWEQDVLMLRSGTRLVAITCSLPAGSRDRWQAIFTGILSGLASAPSRLGD
jgi:hypothetical protein